MLEHGDLIEFPDGKKWCFSNTGMKNEYGLSNGNGYTIKRGSLEEIYNFLPVGCYVIMKDFPYAMRHVEPYEVKRGQTQLTLFD